MTEVVIKPEQDTEMALYEAILTVRPAAIHYGMGIMITQIGVDRFVVRAHPQVPLGLVRH
ncbi:MULTISPECIES: hypothetical protein [unclassified Arthrobacter]|uniref:hypothetical protein n=1 Tax=unclassified Arthrobacter TaxID=235627 RepID=UPI00288309E3|nr:MULTISPECIES: hypothetical protein [unclassified Arthrobacter]